MGDGVNADPDDHTRPLKPGERVCTACGLPVLRHDVRDNVCPRCGGDFWQDFFRPGWDDAP